MCEGGERGGGGVKVSVTAKVPLSGIRILTSISNGNPGQMKNVFF
jgi:hypothetical protein